MINKKDINVGVKRTVTRRYVGYVALNGKVLAKDHKSYSNKESALNRAKLIKELTWRDAVNITNEEE